MGFGDVLWFWILSAILLGTAIAPQHTGSTHSDSGPAIERQTCGRSYQCSMSGQGR